jgi:hypothetical protein
MPISLLDDLRDRRRISLAGAEKLRCRSGMALRARPEPMDTGQAIDFSSSCFWIRGSRATPAPGLTAFQLFFRILLAALAARIRSSPFSILMKV